MCLYMSFIAFSVIPLMVNVLPLLVCPYAKIVAAKPRIDVMQRLMLINSTKVARKQKLQTDATKQNC